MSSIATPKTLNQWIAAIGGLVALVGIVVSVTLYSVQPQMEIQEIRGESTSTNDKLDRLIETIEGIKSDVKDGFDKMDDKIRNLQGNLDGLKDDFGILKSDTSVLKIEVQWIKELLPTPSAQFPQNR